MQGTRSNGRRRKVSAAALTMVVVTGCAALITGAPASASPFGTLPAPLVSLYRPHDASKEPLRVFGESPAGRIFFLTASGFKLAVRHTDGSIHDVSTSVDPLAFSRGEVAGDGRLWGPSGANLVAVSDAGVATPYPISTPDGGVTPTFARVRRGGSGRVWFIDSANRDIGSVASDGTDLQRWDTGGAAAPTHLTLGEDGRMWFTRADGTVAAITAEGVRSEIATLPTGDADAGVDLAAYDGKIWAVADGYLRRVDPDGTVVRAATVNEVHGIAVANGRLWLLRSRAAPTASDLMSIEPRGYAGLYWILSNPIPVPFVTAKPDFSTDIGEWTGQFASLRANGDGTGLLGTSIGDLWKVDEPAPGPQLQLFVSLERNVAGGYRYLHVEVRARTADNLTMAGRKLDVVLWRRTAFAEYVYSSTARTVRTVTIPETSNVVVDIPVVPSMGPDLGPRGTATYGLSIRAHAGGGDLGGSSVVRPFEQLTLGEPMTQLLGIYEGLVGGDEYPEPYRPALDDAGALYWTKRLTARTTTRADVARNVLASMTWRRKWVTQAYWRWYGKAPDSGGRDYWARYLETHTTSDVDLKLGTTVRARDARGTSLHARAQHLAEALGTVGMAEYEGKFARGLTWTQVLNEVYRRDDSVNARARRIQSGGQYYPWVVRATVSQTKAALLRRGDERDALAVVVSTFR